jgi:hypothetical protein
MVECQLPKLKVASSSLVARFFKLPTAKRKSEILGMPYGTAGHRLRKLIMFHLLVKHGEDVCIKCGRQIETISELSIEHIQSWQLNGSELFWDINNIGFSHLKCNRQSISKPGSGIARRKIGPEGTAWCSGCKTFLPVIKFHRNRANWNGYSNCCIACMKAYSMQHKLSKNI